MTRALLFLHCLLVTLIGGSAMAAWETPGATALEMQTAQVVTSSGLNNNYFSITADDVASEVAKQLKLQAVEANADVSLSAGSPKVIHSANHPLQLTVHALQIDPHAKRWQAQANVRANGKTETVKPISGVYVAMIEVPVLKHQVGRTDVIEATDIHTKLVPERLVRKDTVTDAKQLIGQSPRAVISAARPIRAGEVSSPQLVKKGQPVELTYTSQYMTIKASGTALQDGAQGDLIRVKNDKSEKAVSGRVAASGRVEVNQTPTM
jgi:flagella basal body P-ring formation protein FlgA